MTKVSSTVLKTQLGKFMLAVREGKEIVVTDRGLPVARLIPYRTEAAPQGAIVASEPRSPDAPPLGEVSVNPIRYKGPATTAMLLEDRERR
jgi:prevent-host-death family protein